MLLMLDGTLSRKSQCYTVQASASRQELDQDEQCRGSGAAGFHRELLRGTARFVLSAVDLSCWEMCACLTKLMFITEEGATVPGDQLVPSGCHFCWSCKQCSPRRVLGCSYDCRVASCHCRSVSVGNLHEDGGAGHGRTWVCTRLRFTLSEWRFLSPRVCLLPRPLLPCFLGALQLHPLTQG